MLTTKQVAERLGVNPSRVRQIAIAEQLGTKLGRDWVFTEEEVTIMETRQTKPGPATLRDLAEQLIGAGMATDPALGERQTVAVRRALFDRFVAAVAAAPQDDPLARAGQAVTEPVELHDDTAYLDIRALDALDALIHPPMTADEWAAIKAEAAAIRAARQATS